MDSENQTHPREREVFLGALEFDDPVLRKGYIEEECGNDAHLRDRVQSLLAAVDEATMKKPLDDITDLPTVSPAGSGTGPGRWEPPSAEDVSAMLDAYEVSELLGRGGMGAVYKGVQTSLDRPVAIKLLPPELGSDAEFEARFRREAKSMARLNHPNIVQIHDFGQAADGYHFIAMEYVDGTDLQHVIRSGKLDTEQALRAVGQICDALEYAHGEGYVHRDIKPANIFLNQKGTVKVGDFGLAKLVHEEGAESLSEQIGLTQSGMAMGTPLYIAPEQLEKGTKVDQRADIYSLGVMFYEMLTGQIPRGSVRPPSERIKQLDVRIDGVVFKAMEHNPDERYQSATDLRNEMETIQLSKADIAPKRIKKSRTKVAPHPKKKSVNPSSPHSGRMATVISIAALILLLAAGAAYLVTRDRTNPGLSAGAPEAGDTETGDPKKAEPSEITEPSGETKPPGTETPKPENSNQFIAEAVTGDFPCIKLEYQDGMQGEAIEFSTFNYRAISNSSYTIETWFKRDQRNGWIASFDYHGEGITSSSGNRGRATNFRYYNGSLSADMDWEQTAKWNQFAAVRDFQKDENRLYWNGKLVETAPLTKRQIELKEGKGKGELAKWVMGRGLHGWIGETRVSSVVRYTEDFTVERDFQPDEDTVALYKFTEGKGKTIIDHSGNNHHGIALQPIQWVTPSDAKPATNTAEPK